MNSIAIDDIAALWDRLPSGKLYSADEDGDNIDNEAVEALITAVECRIADGVAHSSATLEAAIAEGPVTVFVWEQDPCDPASLFDSTLECILNLHDDTFNGLENVPHVTKEDFNSEALANFRKAFDTLVLSLPVARCHRVGAVTFTPAEVRVLLSYKLKASL